MLEYLRHCRLCARGLRANNGEEQTGQGQVQKLTFVKRLYRWPVEALVCTGQRDGFHHIRLPIVSHVHLRAGPTDLLLSRPEPGTFVVHKLFGASPVRYLD